MSFFGFESYENVIFLGLANLVSFFGVDKLAVIFLG